MLSYLIKKLIILIASLFVVATFTFALMQAIPGDPFTQDNAVPKEILDAMYRHYGLDQPWYQQYLRYMKGIITIDLGPSFKYPGRAVSEIIRGGLPVSLALGSQALMLSILFGIALGSIAALKYSKWQDHLTMVIAVVGISIPSFILGTFLQYFISMKLDLLPIARWGGVKSSILPVIALSALPTAFIARLTRANMIEVMAQDYIQTARAKGLSSFQIVIKHALRNALLPVVTYLGPLTTGILTGSFAVEKIFGIPGLGQWFVMSILNRDYTVIMGITIFYSGLLMICVLLVDIFYHLIDPRIQLYAKKHSRWKKYSLL